MLNNNGNKQEFIDYGNGVYGADEHLPIITVIHNGKYPNGAIKWKAAGHINEHKKILAEQDKFNKKRSELK